VTKIITTIGAANDDESEVVNKVVKAVWSGYYGFSLVGVVKLDEGVCSGDGVRGKTAG